MCGIAGIASLEGFEAARLIEMTHLVKHRGPDGYGFAYFCPTPECRGQIILNEDRIPEGRFVVGLGHRRLAILDLSGLGSQPMQTEDGSLTIVFNGEIYNYIEIRQELERLGFSFRTRSDTEVLLQAYRHWGKECLQRFNGMWSFAIWDRDRRELFCSRDRFGVKPLYYYCDGRRFLFGSEIKQILTLPGVPRQANGARVLDYLEQGILNQSAETLFQGIHELPGGSFLTLHLSSEEILARVNPYWDLPLRPREDVTEVAAREEFIETFRDAVRLRMRSDVPVGSCLSGGLDSSSIVSTARSLANHVSFHTFSAIFQDPRLDETSYIRGVVEAAQAKPHFVAPTGEALSNALEKLLWHQDEPIAGSSVFAQYVVMEAARRESVPVLLDGQGGDETLCGYRKFYYFYLWHLLKRRSSRLVPEMVWHAARGDYLPLHWSDATRYLPAPFRPRKTLLAKVSGNGFATHAFQEVDIGAGESLAARQKEDLVRLSLPVLLRYEDRNSMAHSIETRLPFLDYRLAEFLVNCPESFKLRKGWTKWILREAMAGAVPDAVRWRRTKLGFDTPEGPWLACLRNRVEETFADSQLRTTPFLDAAKVRAEYRRFYAGDRGALPTSVLFRALMLEQWARVHDVCA